MGEEPAGIDFHDPMIVEIPVSDLPRSKGWYARLFGRPPDLEPFPGNIEFHVGGAWVQIVAGEVRPSGWNLQFPVRNIEREHARLTELGFAPPEVKTVPSVIRFFRLPDPDGNGLLFFQVLTDDPKVTGRA